jgi:hypothetical protein
MVKIDLMLCLMALLGCFLPGYRLLRDAVRQVAVLKIAAVQVAARSHKEYLNLQGRLDMLALSKCQCLTTAIYIATHCQASLLPLYTNVPAVLDIFSSGCSVRIRLSGSPCPCQQQCEDSEHRNIGLMVACGMFACSHVACMQYPDKFPFQADARPCQHVQWQWPCVSLHYKKTTQVSMLPMSVRP